MKAPWPTWLMTREFLKYLDVGSAVWIETDDPRQLQRFITNRTRHPKALRERSFESAVCTAVEHARVGVTATVVRITRTA